MSGQNHFYDVVDVFMLAMSVLSVSGVYKVHIIEVSLRARV